MMKFCSRSMTGSLVGGVLLVGLAGCLTPDGRPFWTGPTTPTFDNGNSQTFQKPPNDLSSTAPPDGKDPLPDKKQSGPQFPGTNTPTAKLTLTVKAPRRVQQGSRVTFESVITNTGEAAATDVVISSQYGTDYQFPKQTGKDAHQTLGSLPPGDSRRVDLSLVANKTGNRCVEFSVKTGGREAVWKSVCVNVESPRFLLRVFTPPKRFTGDHIELTALISNQSKDNLKGVTVTVTFDGRMLSPHEASKGVKQEDGRLTWNVNKLDAGTGVPLQAEFRCLQAVPETCVQVRITADDAPTDIQETCFEIAAPHELFSMQLSDTADLLAVGDETAVQLTVGNRTNRRIAGEPVAIVIPPNFRVISTSVERNKTALAAKFEVKDDRVNFDRIPVMPPGDELTYRVKLKALRAGQAVIQAELRPGKTPLLQLSEPVTVN